MLPPEPALPCITAYLQASTAGFAAIVAFQVGTPFAARTQRASLRQIGLTTNRLLLAGIAFELLFATAVIYLPALQTIFGTAPLPWWAVVALLPMPVLVWGVQTKSTARCAATVLIASKSRRRHRST